MMNRLLIATAFVASLAMQAQIFAHNQDIQKVYVSGTCEASDHINNNQEVAFHDEVDTPNEQGKKAEEVIAQIFNSKPHTQIALDFGCEPKECSKCSSPFQILMKRIALGFAIYNISHGAITLANTAGPCIGECAANIASDFGWGAFQLFGALV